MHAALLQAVLFQLCAEAAAARTFWAMRKMTPAGFEPTQLALVELESTPLDHSGKVSLVYCGPLFLLPTGVGAHNWYGCPECLPTHPNCTTQQDVAFDSSSSWKRTEGRPENPGPAPHTQTSHPTA